MDSGPSFPAGEREVGAVLNETWDRSRATSYNKKQYHPGRRPEQGIVPRVNATSAQEGFWSGGGCSRLILMGGTVDIRYGEVCHAGVGHRKSEVRSAKSAGPQSRGGFGAPCRLALHSPLSPPPPGVRRLFVSRRPDRPAAGWGCPFLCATRRRSWRAGWIPAGAGMTPRAERGGPLRRHPRKWGSSS
jgi:hypothetical protein